MIDIGSWMYFILAHPEYDEDEMEDRYKEWVDA